MSIAIKGFKESTYVDLCLATIIETGKPDLEFWKIYVCIPTQDKFVTLDGIRSKAMMALLTNYIDRMFVQEYTKLLCEFRYNPYGYQETLKFINEDEDALKDDESSEDLEEDNEQFEEFLEAFEKACSKLVNVVLNR